MTVDGSNQLISHQSKWTQLSPTWPFTNAAYFLEPETVKPREKTGIWHGLSDEAIQKESRDYIIGSSTRYRRSQGRSLERFT